MNAEQIALPFNLLGLKPAGKKQANDDLVGCTFFDGSATITVVRTCPANPNQVVVERDLDGKSWTAPVWLIRTVVGRKKRRRAA